MLLRLWVLLLPLVESAERRDNNDRVENVGVRVTP